MTVSQSRASISARIAALTWVLGCPRRSTIGPPSCWCAASSRADVVAFAEAAPLVFAAAVDDRAVDQPGPLPGPVTDQPGDRDPAGALAGHRDHGGVSAPSPGPGLRWAQRLTGLVLEDQPRAAAAPLPFSAGHVSRRQVTIAASSRSTARCFGTCTEPRRYIMYAVPRSVYRVWNIRAIRSNTRARSTPHHSRNRAPPDPLQSVGEPRNRHSSSRHRSRQALSRPGPAHHRPAAACASRTPQSATPATCARPPAPARPRRTTQPPAAAVPPHASPAPARTTHLHRDTSSHRSTPAHAHHTRPHRTNLAIQDL